MCASAIDVLDLNGDVHSRTDAGLVEDEPSFNFGSALMCASAMDVVERYDAEGLPPVENAPLTG